MRPVKKSLIDYFKAFVKAHPNRLYLFSEEETLTVKETYRKVVMTAAYLKEKGVCAGDYVGLSGTRSIKAVLLYLATQYLGAIAVFCDPHADVMTCINDMGVNINFKLVIDSVGEEFSVGGEIIDFDALKPCEDFYVQTDVFAPAVVIFTSGSTGVNKGVVLSQYAYVNYIRSLTDIGGYLKRDCSLQMLPIFHVFGLNQIHDTVIHRFANFFPKTVTPEYVLQCIEKYKFTRFAFVPSFALMMADINDVKKYDIESLKAVVISGASSTKEQFDRIESSLGCKLVPVYGMSECPMISGAAPEEPAEKRASSVGKPVKMAKVRIEEDGEITVNCPYLFLGYYGEEPIDQKAYFHTGDLGYFDEDGFLHITGRKKDIIIRNGNNLSPLAIEEKLMKLDFIDAASVVGVKDEVCGEAPAAAIVLKPGASFDEQAVKSVLNKLEMPVEFRFFDKLPLGKTGKTDKKKIKEILSE